MHLTTQSTTTGCTSVVLEADSKLLPYSLAICDVVVHCSDGCLTRRQVVRWSREIQRQARSASARVSEDAQSTRRQSLLTPTTPVASRGSAPCK
ncbi:hypothetical protein IG631_01185 [Alternaria alternata]|nr:hypothetical protein IG631_01185 [Alternaria alternata]